MQATEPLLNEHEAAAVLKLAVPTLRRWRWSGRGPRFVKIGRAVRYDPAELREYVERNKRHSTGEEAAGPGTGASSPARSTATESGKT